MVNMIKRRINLIIKQRIRKWHRYWWRRQRWRRARLIGVWTKSRSTTISTITERNKSNRNEINSKIREFKHDLIISDLAKPGAPQILTIGISIYMVCSQRYWVHESNFFSRRVFLIFMTGYIKIHIWNLFNVHATMH